MFEAKAKIACPECTDIPVIYDEVPKIKEINTESIENVAKSTTSTTSAIAVKANVDINNKIPITVEETK